MTKTTILNTRPISEQRNTTLAFNRHGFNVINFPCIEIIDVDDKNYVIKQLDAIKMQDVIIFTSQHAVTSGFRIKPDWSFPENSIVIAVGTKTAQSLEQNSETHIWLPEQQNSEGVIGLLKGFKKFDSIHLITAKNGRGLIQDYAHRKRIKLQQINVYQRQLPKANDNDTVRLIQETKKLSILATSITGLIHLKQLLNKNLWGKLLDKPLICASTRIADYSKQMQFTNILNCMTAKPELMAKKTYDYLCSKVSLE